MRRHYIKFLITLGVLLPLHQPVGAMAQMNSATGNEARAVLHRAATVMDVVKTVHGDGIVSVRYYRQHIAFTVHGDCDASPARSRSGSYLPVRARTWVRGRYVANGKPAVLDAHYVLIGKPGASEPKVWERSASTHDRWRAGSFTTAGISSYASNLCSVLFMMPILQPTNVKQRYEDLGIVHLANGRARFIRVTAAKPGEFFEYDWYVDPVSYHVVALHTVIGDAAPSPPNTSQSVTLTYSGFNEQLNITAPTTSGRGV